MIAPRSFFRCGLAIESIAQLVVIELIPQLDEAKRNPGKTLSSRIRPTNHVEIRTISRIVRVAEFPQFTRESKPLVKMMIFAIKIWLQGGFAHIRHLLLSSIDKATCSTTPANIFPLSSL
jgi:hypothetical protein